MNIVDHPDLTQRQKQVLQHASEGHSINEIANSLNITPHTVQVHLWGIYKKLGIEGPRKKQRLVASMGDLLERLERLEQAARSAGWKI